MAFEQENELTAAIRVRLKAAGEAVWQRYPLPWSHPSFKSCAVAAANMLDAFTAAGTILVMRDACLAPVRELVLSRGLNLVVPTLHASQVLLIPRPLQGPLILKHLPPGTVPYTGSVDLVVVACLAFTANSRRLYSFEMETGARSLELMREGLDSGFGLGPEVPVATVCADAQEVEGWPRQALAMYGADVVFTPTRVLVLGS